MHLDFVVVFGRSVSEFDLYHGLPLFTRLRIGIEIILKKLGVVRVSGDSSYVKTFFSTYSSKILMSFPNFGIKHCGEVYKLPWMYLPTVFHIGNQILSTYLLHNMGIYGSGTSICIIDELPAYSKAWKIYKINVVGKTKPSIDASIVVSIIKDPLDTAYTCIPVGVEKIKEVKDEKKTVREEPGDKKIEEVNETVKKR